MHGSESRDDENTFPAFFVYRPAITGFKLVSQVKEFQDVSSFVRKTLNNNDHNEVF